MEINPVAFGLLLVAAFLWGVAATIYYVWRRLKPARDALDELEMLRSSDGDADPRLDPNAVQYW